MLFCGTLTTGGDIGPISGGCFTAIAAPDGTLIEEPIRSGEAEVIVDLDFSLIDRRKLLMDSRDNDRKESATRGAYPNVVL